MAYQGILPEIPGFGQQLARSVGQGLTTGFNQGNKLISELAPKKIERDNLISALVNKGVDPEDAKLYASFTTGGQTLAAKDVLEGRKRGLFGGRSTMGAPQQPGTEPQEKQEIGDEDIKDFVEEQDYGLTPSEKVKRGSERYKTGLPAYQEAGAKLRAFTGNKHRLGILEGLNKSDKLPKMLARINVDSDGNLRFPFAASSEAQRFVKTVNEFASGAKDTYGSRVTNFDLAQYLKQFPTLLNSKEGIGQLIDQIRIVNDINSVYYKNLKNVYDKAGGVRNIDSDAAEAMAERMSEPQVEKLSKKFDQIGTFSALPPAKKYKGEKFQDEDTGETYVSDGRQWIKEGKSGV